jgi:hypothetical protein
MLEVPIEKLTASEVEVRVERVDLMVVEDEEDIVESMGVAAVVVVVERGW